MELVCTRQLRLSLCCMQAAMRVVAEEEEVGWQEAGQQGYRLGASDVA